MAFPFEIASFFKKDKQKEKQVILRNDVIPSVDDMGSAVINAGGRFVSPYETDTLKKKYKENIRLWRTIARSTDLAAAINDIVSDAIVVSNTKPIVELNFMEGNKISEKVQEKMIGEFQYLLGLLDYQRKAVRMFESWYIDGSQYIHKVVDPENLSGGILKTVRIGPMAVTPIREVNKETDEQGNEFTASVEEYYLVDKPDVYAGTSTQIKLPQESVSFVHSGQVDAYGNILSYVEAAVKPNNQLTDLEDSTVIYNVARAPQKRVFYVDVGNLPKAKAEQYLNGIISKFKNKTVYDSTTGAIKDGRHIQSMIEDIWLPRKEGSKSTEISTLDGGGSLDNMDDMLYFRKKVYKSQQVPLSRLETESAFSIGRASEISRDELKFARFIDSLRSDYSKMFFDLLKTQLLLKNICNASEWEEMEPWIDFVFTDSSYYQEMAEEEILTGRLALLSEALPYVGKYYSNEWIRRNILKQSETEIKTQDDLMKKEKASGLYKNPDEE